MSTPFTVASQTNDEAEIRVSSHGAQVLEWNPRGERPVLWLSPLAAVDESAPIRGGIPVCLPWFGKPTLSPALDGLDADLRATAPAHGVARTSEWTPVETTGTCSYTLDHERTDLYPHRFTARLDVTAGTSLEVALTVTNTDDHAFVLEEALHTYFAVDDLKDVVIRGLEDAEFVDHARDDRVRTQNTELTFTRSTDRVYRSDADLLIADPRSRRLISIDKDGSRSTIVWTPWAEGAAALADVPDRAWTDFVCVEVGNVRDDALRLAPAESHTLHLVINVQPMA